LEFQRETGAPCFASFRKIVKGYYTWDTWTGLEYMKIQNFADFLFREKVRKGDGFDNRRARTKDPEAPTTGDWLSCHQHDAGNP